MTRSQSYAVELSKDRGIPIVLFDEAEVAMVMNDPSLLPQIQEKLPKGWAHIRTIDFGPLEVDAVDEHVLALVEREDVTYGFALIGASREKLKLGVFEKVPVDAEKVEEVFVGRVREPVTL